jgi:hypothetical protein
MIRAWSLTLLLATSCSGATPTRAADPPATATGTETRPPAARAPAASALPPSLPPDAAPSNEPGDADQALPPASAPEPAPPRPTPTLRIEPVYSAQGHARLATEMLTLERDEELFQWALGGSSSPEHPANRPGYHPATRVVVDVELLSRAPKGTTARLRRIARANGYWPLRACFEAAQRALIKSERTARVRLTLSATGKVLGARSMGPAQDRDYARCARERLRALDFSPGFTRKLDVEISVKQWPGHAPTPPRAPEGSPVVALGRAGTETLSALEPALLGCYQRGLDADARLWGRLALRLRLSNEGVVEDATQVETRFPDETVAACVSSTLLGVHLPASTRDLSLAVRFGQRPLAAPEPPAEASGTAASNDAKSAPTSGD